MFSDNFPSEIWREILVRLPAESLIRSRAVCKGWRAVIDDPCFVRAHTNNHQQQFSSANIIFQHLDISPDIPFYSLDLEALSCSNGHQTIAATPLDLDFISENTAGLLLPVAACNGLVLTQNPLAIWNPLTHERLELPGRGDFSYLRAFGLGYDCLTDDYKAVLIMGTRDTHVYSLKPDSWRRIMNCPLLGPVGDGVFVCEGLNWLSIGKGCVYDDKIVALDLGTEKYRLLQMPRQRRWNKPKQPSYPHHDMMLNVLDGCLALCDSGFNTHLDVWVMKDYGDEDSWIKLFSIEREHNISMWYGFLMPVAFIVKERFVFLRDSYKMFFLVDFENKSLKSVKIDCSGLYTYAKQMFVGTIFCLHANCGGGVRKIAMSCAKKKRKITSCTKKKKASADVKLVFCIRDANGNVFGSCSERGCLSGENEGPKLLEDSICS